MIQKSLNLNDKFVHSEKYKEMKPAYPNIVKRILPLLIFLTLLHQYAPAQETACPLIGAQVFIEPGQSENEIETCFKAMRTAGMEVARIRMFGSQMIREDGTVDFRLYDHAFDCAEKYGIKLFATLFPPTDELTDVGGFKFPDSIEHLHEIEFYIRTVVTHFSVKPALYVWVLQNEPGTGGTVVHKTDLSELVRKKFEKEEFVSTSDFYHFDDSKYDTDDLARTAYLGSGKSAISYRFYDKDREVSAKYNKSLDEIGSWKRTEIQLRDEKAHAFAMLFEEKPMELGELAFGLLAENLRFVVPNKNESNKSRWKTCRFWKRFLGNVEPLKLHIPKTQNSLLETQQWLTDGGVISAVKGFYFLEEHDALGELKSVGEMLDKARYSPPLSGKLTGHLQRIGREELIPHIQYDTNSGKRGAV